MDIFLRKKKRRLAPPKNKNILGSLKAKGPASPRPGAIFVAKLVFFGYI
jgi:hypothetical protein